MTEKSDQIEAFKGFDEGMQCRGFRYEVGKTYTMAGRVRVCDQGFHACEHPFHIWDYYPGAGITKPAALVTLGGETDRQSDGDTKIAAAEITIKDELKLPELIRRGVAWILKQAAANAATGAGGHAAATGYRGHAAAHG